MNVEVLKPGDLLVTFQRLDMYTFTRSTNYNVHIPVDTIMMFVGYCMGYRDGGRLRATFLTSDNDVVWIPAESDTHLIAWNYWYERVNRV